MLGAGLVPCGIAGLRMGRQRPGYWVGVSLLDQLSAAGPSALRLISHQSSVIRAQTSELEEPLC